MNIKVLHILLILFFLLPIFNISADETWEDLPEQTERDDDFTVGTAESGCEVLIFYGEGKTSLTKPVIFVEGIDLENKFGWDDHYAKVNPETGEKEGILFQQNIVYRILQEGYDFVFVNFNDSLLSLETNGDNLILAIEEINSRKESAGGSADNVVLGASMGGVVARYALTKMENLGKDHDTRLFVSLDAPQQGAYMPPSIPLFLKLTQNELNSHPIIAGDQCPSSVKDKIRQIKSDACRQLFITTFTEIVYSSDPYNISINLDSSNHEAFFSDLMAMAPSEMGYPKNLKKIAISNGSGEGLQQYPSLNQGDLIIKAHWWVDVGILYKYFELDFEDYNMGYDDEDPLDIEMTYISGRSFNSTGIHNAPGSYMPLYRQIGDILEEEHEKDDRFHVRKDIPVENTSFIPTVSALDLRDPVTGEPLHPFTNLSADPQIKAKTVFDDIHWEPDNNQHDTYLSAEAAQFILDNIFQTAEMSVIYNLLLSD